MLPPADRFKKYLSERRIAETVTALSTHHTSLWRIANGLRRPGLALAFAIQELTRRWPGGQIRAEEWIAADVSVESEAPPARQARRAGGTR